MSLLAGNISGTGAMLARLVQLGARCGLSAETTLLHILDGAPLDAAVADLRSELIAECEASAGCSGLTRASRDSELIAECEASAGIDTETTPPQSEIDQALRPAVKSERIANLYALTVLRNAPIAKLVDTTPGTVSFFVRRYRKAGDPRIVQGDRRRGILPSGAEPPSRAPMAVDGVGDDWSTDLQSQSDNILPAGFNGESGRADPVPDVSPERAYAAGGVAPSPQASPRPLPPVFVSDEIHEDRELGMESPTEEASECAERDAGSMGNDSEEAVAAIPAPPAVQEDEPEKGDVSQQQPVLDPPEAADTAARPAGPGQDLAVAADHIAVTGKMVASPADEEAGDAIPPAEPASSSLASPDPEPPASDDAMPTDSAAHVLTLFRDTTTTLGEIALRVGITTRQVGAIIASGRRRGDPRVAAGDIARERKAATQAAPPAAPETETAGAAEEETTTGTILRLWKETLKGVTEIAAEVGWAVNKTAAVLSTKRKRGNPNVLAGDAARSSANARRAEEPRSPAAPAREEGPPDDLALLGLGDVLVIDRGWIVGPLDVRKGFSLINSVLGMLGKGDPIDADEIARECGVRSGGAVLKQLDHWKADLAAIGVDIIRLGGAVVGLRRAS